MIKFRKVIQRRRYEQYDRQDRRYWWWSEGRPWFHFTIFGCGWGCGGSAAVAVTVTSHDRGCCCVVVVVLFVCAIGFFGLWSSGWNAALSFLFRHHRHWNEVSSCEGSEVVVHVKKRFSYARFFSARLSHGANPVFAAARKNCKARQGKTEKEEASKQAKSIRPEQE